MRTRSQVKSSFKVSIHPSTLSLLLFLLPLSPHPFLRLGGFQLDSLGALLVALETATCSLHGETNVARRTELDPGPWSQLASKSTALIQPKDEAASLPRQPAHTFNCIHEVCGCGQEKKGRNLPPMESEPSNMPTQLEGIITQYRGLLFTENPSALKIGFHYLVPF